MSKPRNMFKWLLFVFFLCISSFFIFISASSSDPLSTERKDKNKYRRTDLAFLDDLSSTQSASDMEPMVTSNNPKSFQDLETETESGNVNETDFEKETMKMKNNEMKKAKDTVDSSESLSKSGGPSEEDRLIDDNLTFLIPYYEIFENFNGPSNPFRRFIFILLITFLLALLFYLMYSISSDYLTPSLAHLSSACRMSPDMAGLTFLAFGNGAPDLFTAMLGAEDAPEMILGSSVGSGLFIFTVVFGLVICFARDPNIPQSSSTAMVLAFPSPKTATSRVKIGRGTFWRNALMYAGCVVALAVFVIKRDIPIWQPSMLIVLFFIYLFASIGAHYLLPKKSNNRHQSKEAELGTAAIGNESEGSMHLLDIEKRRHKLQELSISEQFKVALIQITEWNELGFFGKSFWILTSPLRLILNLTILPLPDPTLMESPDKLLAHWFLSRFLITINPFGSILLLGWLFGIGSFLVESVGFYWTVFTYFAVSFGLIGIFHLGSSSISNPLAGSERNWRTCLPLWTATVYSFSCCIAWIFAVSNELVAALSSLGLILGVSRTVMGCLVLAWGNSIGDLIADVALARNGSPQTAITAIFSGPVQNVLLTIGISFMAAASQSPDKTIHLHQLRGDIHLSLALLAVVICASLVLIPGYFNYRIPRQFGVALILVYIIYVPFSLWLGINH